MTNIETAIKTISDIYDDYFRSETDTVNLSRYDAQLLGVHTLLENYLQEKQERDNMRCENCEWFERERFFLDDEVPMSEQTIYTCTFYGDDAPDGIPIENNHFCSHYEPKEQVKHNE